MLKITPISKIIMLLSFGLLGVHSQGQIIDEDFSDDGMTNTVFTAGAASVARAIGVQSDGKLVAVGYDSGQMGSAFAMARYLVDGTLDTSFGSDGNLVINVSGLTSDAYEIAFDSSGNIFVSGIADLDPSENSNLVDVLIKMTSDGTLDDTFGTAGVVTTKFGSAIQSLSTSVLVQSDGKIILGGSVNNGTSTGNNSDIALARINTDGTIDDSFGDLGFQIIDAGAYDILFKLAFTQDEKIVAAGYSINDFGLETESSNAIITTINTDGNVDENFGTAGIARLELNTFSYAYDVAVQINDKIVIAGETLEGAVSDFFTARYNTDGTLDDSFNDNGIVQTNFLAEENIEEAYSISIQQNERIVVAGAAGSTGTRYIAIARFMPNGKYDEGFGDAGKYLYETDAGKSINILDGELLTGNKLILAGRSQVSGRRAFFLSQFSLDEKLSVNTNDLVSLSVYPNPASDLLKFEFSEDIADTTVTIYDATGRAVKNQALAHSRVLNISDLSGGVYLVQVSQGEQLFTKKIMKR